MLQLDTVFFIALLTAFFILLIGKLGIRDWLINNLKLKLLVRLLECDYCLCFWISIAISATSLFVFDVKIAYAIMYAICSTPIARFLL